MAHPGLNDDPLKWPSLRDGSASTTIEDRKAMVSQSIATPYMAPEQDTPKPKKQRPMINNSAVTGRKSGRDGKHHLLWGCSDKSDWTAIQMRSFGLCLPSQSRQAPSVAEKLSVNTIPTVSEAGAAIICILTKPKMAET